MKFKTILRTIPAMALALFVCSCNNDSDTPSGEDGTQVDFVTIKSLSNTGASFELQKEGDSPVLTLVTSRRFPEELKVGQRILLRYAPANGKPYTSGTITPTGYMTIYDGPVTIGTAEEYRGFTSEDARVEICQRAGKYVNIAARCFMLNQPKSFELVCDKTTLNSESPVMYLLYKSDSNSVDGAYSVVYGSWDISEVWNLPTCKNIRIKSVSTAGEETTTIIKDASQITPTE